MKRFEEISHTFLSLGFFIFFYLNKNNNRIKIKGQTKRFGRFYVVFGFVLLVLDAGPGRPPLT